MQSLVLMCIKILSLIRRALNKSLLLTWTAGSISLSHFLQKTIRAVLTKTTPPTFGAGHGVHSLRPLTRSAGWQSGQGHGRDSLSVRLLADALCWRRATLTKPHCLAIMKHFLTFSKNSLIDLN